jgi:D-alanyl-lipoteichoic acid acyltransferase DltB (MBOAT superfamily)
VQPVPTWLAASLFFYAWAGPRFVLLLLYVIAVNFVAGLMIARSPRKKLWLAGAVVATLAPLLCYKYVAFGMGSLNAALPRLGVRTTLPIPAWVLPAGLSFFTFHALAAIDFAIGATSNRAAWCASPPSSPSSPSSSPAIGTPTSSAAGCDGAAHRARPRRRALAVRVRPLQKIAWQTLALRGQGVLGAEPSTASRWPPPGPFRMEDLLRLQLHRYGESIAAR